jgi:thiol:disulfide interchange protein DsbC
MKRIDYLQGVAAGLLTMLVAGPAGAQEDLSNLPDYSNAEAQLRVLAPNATSIALSETPIDGLLQAQVNNEILYVSTDGVYLLQGSLFEIETRTNLTDEAKSLIRKDIIAEIDYSEQIVFSPDDPKYQLLVFTDIDCGYCRKLHSQIDEYMAEGIAIHYMAYPRAGVASHSYDKFVSVYCADDPKDALTLAKGGSEPDPLQCENPVDEQYELGRQIGVSGTPALLTSDGTMIPGYMPPEKLRQRLEAIEAQLAAAP